MMVEEEEPMAGFQAAQEAEFRQYRHFRKRASARNGVGGAVVKERSNVESRASLLVFHNNIESMVERAQIFSMMAVTLVKMDCNMIMNEFMIHIILSFL